MSGSIEWADVKPGMVVMGSANRSILFGGIGPRHEVSIGYRFKISRIPVPSSEALKIIQTSEADIASESEWELANSRGLLSAEIGCIERLEDRHHGYWGKICDGRPHYGVNSGLQNLRHWSKSGPVSIQRPTLSEAEKTESVRLVIREDPNWSDDPLAIPIRKDNQRIILEEALISLFWEFFPPSYGLTITQATDIFERVGST
ncbi:MAG: hypothetical protein MKZ60_01765 [Candidatus Thalassarchaeum sp.]|nr:hypothetical protein [Candidatus Thalassarchaeum sp.]